MQDESSDVIPLLACADIASEHDWLVNVLGFESVEVVRSDARSAVHAEIRVGRRRIWLHPVNEGELVPPGRGPRPGGIVVHVPDVDEHYERARTMGAEILSAPRDEDYGQREYGVGDPEGHLWWIATPTRSPPPR